MSQPLDAARALRELIEAEAQHIEERSTLTDAVVEAIAASGLFRLLVPSDLGGMEADPRTIVDVCEELSFADGSTGWAFAQNTTTMAYSAYLEPTYAAEVARSCAAAGMFAPLGIAHKEDAGYRISGRFKFGSGSGHAEFIGGAAVVMQDGQPVAEEDGYPPLRGFIVPASRAVLKGNWDVMGLRGTGSFDFEIPEQFVDSGMTFPIFGDRAVTGGAFYGIGPIAVGNVSSVGWAVGVARRALDEIAKIAAGGRMRLGSLPLRDQPGFQRDLGAHTTALKAARLGAVHAYGEAVEAVASAAPAEARAQKVREAMAATNHAVHMAKAATTFAYEASGSAGMRNPSVLQRCFRDIYVGSAHQVFDDRNFVDLAKPALGLDPSAT